MIGRVGEKETGTPLLKPISKMSLFRLLSSCLPINTMIIDLLVKYIIFVKFEEIYKAFEHNNALFLFKLSMFFKRFRWKHCERHLIM